MKTKALPELLADHPFFRGLPPDQLQLLAGCARNRIAAPGDFLAREGKPADTFYLLRQGKAAIEISGSPGTLRIQTLGPGEVIGWSWLIPPHQWTFDVRVLNEAHLVSFDGACLRKKCEDHPVLGYGLLKRFTRVLVDRLTATRLQLLDLYGGRETGVLG